MALATPLLGNGLIGMALATPLLGNGLIGMALAMPLLGNGLIGMAAEAIAVVARARIEILTIRLSM
jgi:hypothetical protein